MFSRVVIPRRAPAPREDSGEPSRGRPLPSSRPRTAHSTQGGCSSSTGSRGAAPGVTGGGRGSFHSDRWVRIARTTCGPSMKAMMRIAPPQSGHTSGSAAKILL